MTLNFDLVAASRSVRTTNTVEFVNIYRSSDAEIPIVKYHHVLMYIGCDDNLKGTALLHTNTAITCCYISQGNLLRTKTSQIHCVQEEKRDQNVICNISYKTQAILTKFGTPFPE